MSRRSSSLFKGPSRFFFLFVFFTVYSCPGINLHQFAKSKGRSTSNLTFSDNNGLITVSKIHLESHKCRLTNQKTQIRTYNNKLGKHTTELTQIFGYHMLVTDWINLTKLKLLPFFLVFFLVSLVKAKFRPISNTQTCDVH